MARRYDVAAVFAASCTVLNSPDGVLLKSPNERGDGWSKVELIETDRWADQQIHRVVVKTQYRYDCRPLWNALRKTPRVHRECRALQKLRRGGVAVPKVLSYSYDGTEAVLITDYVEGGLSLDKALGLEGVDRDTIISAVAIEIGRLHRIRWTHGALYPAHLLITEPLQQPRVHLIDLEKAKYLRNQAQDLYRFWRYAHFISATERTLFESVYQNTLRRGD